MKKNKKVSENQALIGILSSLGSILLGLLFGFLMLIIFKPANAADGFGKILFTGISSPDRFGKVLYQASPLIMTGLAVAFAYKTGLFNIGASGQYLMGAFFALVVGVVFKLPWWVALLASIVGGAFWGIFPGLFKALFNVNEVITAIMFNWICLFMVNMCMSNIPSLLANYYGASNADRTASVATANKAALIPKLGLDKLFNSSYINIGIFIAVIVAILAYIIISKTTFGYELKACGFNKKASLYAGINANKNIVLSMIISGAFAGLGGGIFYLGGTVQYTLEKVLLAMGFNGIPVALLANSHPIGTIFSAVFISYIQVGGEALQPEYAKEIIDIIIASIIYLSALSVLMRGFISRLISSREKKSPKENDVKEVES